MSPWEVLLCALLIATSAFMNASEIALFSTSRFQLRSLKDKFSGTHRKIKRLLADPAGLLISILIIGEVVNVTLSTLIARAVTRSWNPAPAGSGFAGLPLEVPPWLQQTLIGTAITAPLVLFFCEITPKVIGARANRMVATLAAGPLTIVYDLLKPFRWLIKVFVKGLSGLLGRQPKAAGHGLYPNESLLNEEDFLVMLEEGHKEGAIHETEVDLIRNVFDLDDTAVMEVMMPISRVFTLNAKLPLADALHVTQSRKYSRIPVTGPNRRRIIGVLYKKDLLLARMAPDFATLKVEDLMRRPLAVNTQSRLNSVFRKLKQNQTHIAIVENVAGGEALGIVTMHDVLDEIFDDLFARGET